MVIIGDQPQAVSSTTEFQLTVMQIEQAIESYRTIFSLLTQITTVMVIANVTIVGYAISQQIGGILFISALFPIALLYVVRNIMLYVTPIAYTAVSLEKQYGSHDSDWLASTCLSTLSTEYVANLEEINSIENPVDRIERLRVTSPSPPITRELGLGQIALVVLALGQIVAPVLLTRFFGWQLF